MSKAGLSIEAILRIAGTMGHSPISKISLPADGTNGVFLAGFWVEGKVNRLNRAVEIGVVASIGLLFVTFYPGGMSIDSYTQLSQARGGHLGDWHPPFMAWMWGGLDSILRGSILMLVAQLGLFLFALQSIAGVVVGGSGTGRSWFVLLSMWVTPVSGIVGVVWKDVWTSCLLLVGAACCLLIGGVEQKTRHLRTFFLGTLAFLGALLFRQNAVFAVIPLLAYGVWALRGSHRSMRSALEAVAIGALCTIVLSAVSAGVNRTLTVHREYPLQSILIFDVAGVSVASNRSDFLGGASATIPDVVRGRSTVEVATLRAAYFPSTWTPLVFVEGSPLAVSRSASQVDALAAIWWRAVREEPQAYLAHRAGVFCEVIGAHERKLFAPVYFGMPRDSPDYAGVRRLFPAELEAVSPVQEALRSGFEWSAEFVIYRPWLWLLLNLLLIAVAAGLSRRRAGMVALGFSGLLYELALFFIAPSADYRYSHWLVLSTWVLLAALVSELGAGIVTRIRGAGDRGPTAQGS